MRPRGHSSNSVLTFRWRTRYTLWVILEYDGCLGNIRHLSFLAARQDGHSALKIALDHGYGDLADLINPAGDARDFEVSARVEEGRRS